jgi:hypothetical protein
MQLELNQENFDTIVNTLLDFKARIKALEGTPTKKAHSNKYTKDENDALLEACQGLTMVPKGAIRKVTDQLIADGWNNTWDQNRNGNSLRTHYLRLTNQKD